MYSDLGSYLQRLRVRKDLTLKSISHKTKIRESILKKIEDGQIIEMPTFVQKSYIRNFSKVVGADPEKIEIILNSLDKQIAEPNETEQPLSKIISFLRLPKLNLIVTALTVIFLFSLTWFLRDSQLDLKMDETASYNLEAKFYQKENKPQFPSSIESLLNSPNPSSDRSIKTP